MLKESEGEPRESDIDKAHERAKKADRRAFGDPSHLGVPDISDDIENTASNTREVEPWDVKKYVSKPGDLVHKVAFITQPNEKQEWRENLEYQGWIRLLREGTPLVYEAKKWESETALSVYMTFINPKDPDKNMNYGVSGINAVYGIGKIEASTHEKAKSEGHRTRGYPEQGPEQPGFEVVFSDSMKKKLSSPDLSREELLELYQPIDDHLKSFPGPVEQLLACGYKGDFVGNQKTRVNDEIELSMEGFDGWLKALHRLEREIRIDNPEGYHNYSASDIVALAIYYRSLEEGDIESAQRAQVVFGLGGFDRRSTGVRLAHIAKDKEGNLEVRPCIIEKEDIKAVIVPTPSGIITHGLPHLIDYKYSLSEFDESAT